MKALTITIICLGSLLQAKAQPNYTDSALARRQAYREEFVTDSHSPLSAADTGFLQFYPVDERYRCVATLKLTPAASPVAMATHKGTTKEYVEFAVATCRVPGKGTRTVPVQLHLYRSTKPIADSAWHDHLFLPFYDLTNGRETYGGGRYLDLRERDIRNGTIVIDFNRTYNMYCAYTDGYACPIPPDENRLPLAIRAGEKLFARPAPVD